MISQETIDTILSTANIVDIISEFSSLKKKGVNYVGCCPFHQEKTASFVVSQAKEIYKCFGCAAGGNVIKFVQEHEHLSFPAAAKYVADKYNIQIDDSTTPAEKAEHGHREALKNVLKWSAKQFNSQTHIPAASKYFDKRKIAKEIIEEFNLGYALDEWNSLEKAAADDGYRNEILIQAGLLKKNDNNKIYDYFRNRIMFPFLDITGNVIGFTGRDISDAKDTAKYLNSPDTELFNKGNVLYGLYQAKRHIVKNDFAYLVEGNVDVIRWHAMDIKNTVAGSGTAFTKAQAQQLKRFAINVTVVYDGDLAGIKATFRNIDILLENGLNVRAIMLPEGEDPDSFGLKKTPEQLKKYLENNEKDFITLKFELLKEGEENPVALAAVAKEILHSISLIPDDITRNAYKKQCISKFKFEEKEVSDFWKSIKKQKFSDKNKPALNTINGWIGLDFATESIQEKEECLITLNHDKLMESIGDGDDNTICHSGAIENIHIQELNKISQNIVIIDKIDIDDIDKNTKIIQLGIMLFKNRMNVKVHSMTKIIWEDNTETEESSYRSFLDNYVIISSGYIIKNAGDELIKKNHIEKIAELLSYADNTVINISTAFIAKTIGIKEIAFKNILKPFIEKRNTKIKMTTEGVVSEGELLTFDPDRLPSYVDQEFFRRYSYFPAQNSKGTKVAYVFRTENQGLITVGNFYMEPLFHVYHSDPLKNKRIIQINNGEQNKQFYMELTSDSMADFNSFKKCLWREGGNVFSKGKPLHYEMILSSLANRFPLCNELNEFGQQHEGFYAFTNAIFSEDEIKYTDEFGLVKHKDLIYYSPAFSKIYSGQRKSDDKYEQDRHFVFKENKDTDFETWALLLCNVYAANDNGKWALIMAILSAFRSVIYPIDRLFTSLFFSGPTESGKTQIAVSIRSLFMTPEAPLFNLNSGTDAAFFSTLERYRDVPIIFEEYNDYQISDSKFQGLKAAVYDGEGKTKRKDATSKDLDVSKVNGVPLLLGQERPERDDGSLGNRCILKQVPKKSDWTDEEVALFQNLKSREKKGLTNILIDILRIRPLIAEHFSKQQRITFKELKSKFREKGITVENRITNTVSLFTAMVKVLETYAPHLKLPFTFEEFFQLAQDQIIEQSEQILSTNRLSGFFESIEILMLRDKLLIGRDFKLETEDTITLKINSKETIKKDFETSTKLLYLRIGNIHSHYMELKKTEALKMGNLRTYIKDHPSYIGEVESTRFNWIEVRDSGDPLKDYATKKAVKVGSVTSALVFDYKILLDTVTIDLEKYGDKEGDVVQENVQENVPIKGEKQDDFPF